MLYNHSGLLVYLRGLMMLRNRRIVFVLMGAALVMALAYPLWSPIFRTDVVDEAFPALNTQERAMLRELPADQQAALVAMSAENAEMAGETARAMLENDQMMDETMPEMSAEPVIVADGSFIRIDAIHAAEGRAVVYALGGERLLRFEDFRVTNGPDLHVFLSRNVPTQTFEGLGDNPIDLGQLKGNVGNQNYTIPAEIDLSLYHSVVIYCVPFGVAFSSAALTAPVGG